MATCSFCRRQVSQTYEYRQWDDEADDRYMYSVVMNTDELEMNFPGHWRVFLLCADCSYKTTGFPAPPSEVKVPEPIKEAYGSRFTFNARSLQASLASAIARAMFERVGYQVRHSGYEYTLPDWVEKMKRGDANLAVLRVRNIPDLKVYDPDFNTLYDIEMKSTLQRTNRWRYRKDSIDTLLSFAPDVLIMVYFAKDHRFYCQYANKLDWQQTRLITIDTIDFYEFDVSKSFASPSAIFARLDEQKYQAFLLESSQVLRQFATGKN